MISQIKFGTSGHRGIMGESFTHEHIQAICLAIGELLKEEIATPKLLIGYDSRKGNINTPFTESFPYSAKIALEETGCTVDICKKPVPTPCISWAVNTKDYDAGIILTASHNPPEYNGLKMVTSKGAPAPIELTNKIEKLANNSLNNLTSLPKEDTQVKYVNLEKEFTTHLLSSIKNLFPKTEWSKSKIGIDCKHGASGAVWEEIKNVGVNTTLLHKEAKTDFGQKDPNPTNTQNLTELIQIIKEKSLPMGVAHDPDADRHIILDETGSPLTPEETTAILGIFFKEQHTPVKEYISTLASSRIIKTLAKLQKSSYTETAVGFKHFTKSLQNAKDNDALAFAVESSGGFSSSLHTLEKCGLYPALLVYSCLQHTQSTLSELKESLKISLGEHYFLETSTIFNSKKKEQITHLLKSSTSESLQIHFSTQIKEIDKRDGLKIVFKNDDWLCIRLSGTEPVARLYAESSTKHETRQLLKIGEQTLSAFT